MLSRRYCHVDLPDTPDQDLQQHWRRTSAFIAEGLAAGGSVLVHCVYGKVLQACARACTLLLVVDLYYATLRVNPQVQRFRGASP